VVVTPWGIPSVVGLVAGLGRRTLRRRRRGAIRGVAIVVTRKRRPDYERRDGEHRSEERQCGERSAPVPAAAVHAQEQRDRRDHTERSEQQGAPNSGEKRSAGERPGVMKDVRQYAQQSGGRGQYRQPQTRKDRRPGRDLHRWCSRGDPGHPDGL
jgi:hypothetical protein